MKPPGLRLAAAWQALRLRRWPRPLERGQVSLGRQRIYVLPTRAGLAYALALGLMLVASINYNLSLGYALTFLLAALGVVCIVETHRNLAGLRIACSRPHPGFVGQHAGFGLALAATPRRHGILLQLAGAPPQRIDVDTDTTCLLNIPAVQRGRLDMPCLHIRTTWPLGLLQAWSVVHFEQHTCVYPAPAVEAPPPVRQQGQLRPLAGDDFRELRGHRPGDPPQHVAWKISARMEGGLLTKQFQTHTADSLHLDLATTPGADPEARLSVIARQILDAEQQGQRYSLQLGRRHIPPGHGRLHRDRCLEALALHV